MIASKSVNKACDWKAKAIRTAGSKAELATLVALLISEKNFFTCEALDEKSSKFINGFSQEIYACASIRVLKVLLTL